MTQTTDADEDAPRRLDRETVAAVSAHVDAAKARGWLQADLKRWFNSKGVEHAVYKAALAGETVPASAFHALAAISIHGLSDLPYQPNDGHIRQHLEWLAAPARGQFDDALIEIAWAGPTDDGQIRRAKLFGLDEIDDAVVFAVLKNLERSNVYVGAALRLPDADRGKRASAEDFYVATAVPIDIDRDYDTTRAAMAAVCDDGLVVTTGLTPQRRSQHWTRLVEPCDSDIEFGHAFRGLVEHVGADMAVKDAARVMRLGGTLAFPNVRKVGLGYCTELTSLTINEAARSSDLARLRELAAGEAAPRRDYSERPQADGIERAGILHSGKVVNGRERFFATKLLPRVIRSYQDANGCDPSLDELWQESFALFEAEADNTDQRWTSPDGQRQLQARAANTLRRLRIGRMAQIGLYSIDTGVAQAEAETARATFEANRAVTIAPEPEPVVVTEPEGPVGSLGFRLTDWTARRYEGEAKAIEWLCEGTVPLGIPVLFAAMGGMGKSFIALDAGLEVAVATTSIAPRTILGGQIMQRGRAVILSAEDSRDSIHRRLEKIDAGRRRDRDPDKLMIVPLPDAGGPKPLIASDGKSLALTPAFHDLVAQLSAIEDLKLVVIDPLQAFVMADINADPAAGQFMWSAFASLCAVTGATVIVCHHMRKQGAMSIRTPEEAREAIRGSTALVDGARLTFALWKTPDDDARDICARLDLDFNPDLIAGGAVVKANDEANRNVRTYVRQESGLLVDATDRVGLAKAAPPSITTRVAQDIITEIDKAWHEATHGRGEGYAMSPQSGERQAWKLIQRRAGCTQKEARDLAAAWVANDILQMQTVNAKLHRSALRAIGRLE